MIKPYDRISALDYALKYALAPNPNYYHFGGIGGDCTNFVSQCVYAGSKIMNFDKYNGWYYISSSSRSPSWTSVNFFQNFILNNNSIGPFGKKVEKSELEVGDIIQLRQQNVFNHSLFVTKIENNQIYISSHSSNELNRPINTYYYNEILYIKILGIYYN